LAWKKVIAPVTVLPVAGLVSLPLVWWAMASVQ
jgi:hypothetical protein